MGSIIKKIFGDYGLMRINDFKQKLGSNESQKEAIENKRKFYSSFINKGDLCFDVGANSGNRVSVFLKIEARVVAIEPQESCCRFLKYKFGKQIDIIPKGLGEANCVKNLYVGDSNVVSTFSEEWKDTLRLTRFKRHSWDNVVEVEMTTADDLIEKYGIPSFMKIDVEGYELNVLRGLTKPVNMISFEYAVPEKTNSVIECIRQIEKINPNIECNYSIDESMEFALPKWLSVSKICEHILTKEFENTSFGDVYVRSKSNTN